MEEKVWTEAEGFAFPGIGNVTGSELIQVKPVWQMVHETDSVRLEGVYHIASRLKFNPEETNEFFGDNVLIDDVDLDGETGYFEYAVPFTINLPEDAGAPRLVVQNERTLLKDGHCKICWDVSCSYAKLEPVTSFAPKVEVEDIQPIAYAQEEVEHLEEDSTHSITSAPTIWDLIDRYSVTEFKLNNIVRK